MVYKVSYHYHFPSFLSQLGDWRGTRSPDVHSGLLIAGKQDNGAFTVHISPLLPFLLFHIRRRWLQETAPQSQQHEVDDDVVTFPESLLPLVFCEGSWQCDGIPQLLVHLQVSAQASQITGSEDLKTGKVCQITEHMPLTVSAVIRAPAHQISNWDHNWSQLKGQKEQDALLLHFVLIWFWNLIFSMVQKDFLLCASGWKAKPNTWVCLLCCPDWWWVWVKATHFFLFSLRVNHDGH